MAGGAGGSQHQGQLGVLGLSTQNDSDIDLDPPEKLMLDYVPGLPGAHLLMLIIIITSSINIKI